MLDISKAHPLGKTVPCSQCADLLSKSRLTLEEQGMTVDSIGPRDDDQTGEDIALRFLGKEMLRDPFGFLSICGPAGNAKSLLLVALIAEFCRRGRQAVYLNADELVYLINPGEDKKIDGLPQAVTGEPGAMMRYFERVPVLAIDEIDKIGWTAWQVQRIGALIEHRHRNAERLVTLLAMNRPPEQWRNAGDVEHIADRLTDGRFRRYWPQDRELQLPSCLAEYKEAVNGVTVHYAPGLFQTRLPSLRRHLRRDGRAQRQPAKAQVSA